MKLIIGLGNPGKTYEKTRHNAGFLALDRFHKAVKPLGVSAWELSKKFNGFIAGGMVHDQKIILLKPTTFMNESGQALFLLASFYKIPTKDVIVVHDDIDIPLGEIKVQTNRGHAGHNGVRSIIDTTGTKEFTRIRVGIRPKQESQLGDRPKFVLQKFGLLERRALDQALEATSEAIFHLLKP
jgi:PTH1 family peptidyl-tRNA hydrolase